MSNSSIDPALTEPHPKFELTWYGVLASQVAGAQAGTYFCLFVALPLHVRPGNQTPSGLNIRKHIIPLFLRSEALLTGFAVPSTSKQNVEDDLTGNGTHALPTLIARLLVIMTHDRKITYGSCARRLRRRRRASLTLLLCMRARVFSPQT